LLLKDIELNSLSGFLKSGKATAEVVESTDEMQKKQQHTDAMEIYSSINLITIFNTMMILNRCLAKRNGFMSSW